MVAAWSSGHTKNKVTSVILLQSLGFDVSGFNFYFLYKSNTSVVANTVWQSQIVRNELMPEFVFITLPSLSHEKQFTKFTA